MNLSQIIEYATGPGIAVIAGILISMLVEYWPAFQAMSAKGRVLCYVLLCLLVPVAATAAGVATGISGSLYDIDMWVAAISAGIAASGVGTLFHAYVPEPASARKTNAVV